jgi:hypothetical protein
MPENLMLNLTTIIFERTGGFTGMPLQTVLPVTSLNAEEASEIIRLLDTSGFFGYESPGLPEGRIPDQFIYRIEVELTHSRHVVMVYEQQVTEDFRPLIRFLIRKAKGIL